MASVILQYSVLFLLYHASFSPRPPHLLLTSSFLLLTPPPHPLFLTYSSLLFTPPPHTLLLTSSSHPHPFSSPPPPHTLLFISSSSHPPPQPPPSHPSFSPLLTLSFQPSSLCTPFLTPSPSTCLPIYLPANLPACVYLRPLYLHNSLMRLMIIQTNKV